MVKKNTSQFQYGWCYSDHKDGKNIRLDWRNVDYMKSPVTRDFVYRTLENYGLPKPDIDNEVFRGTHHDLLFLDSHGVTIRIGKTDVEQLVNPAIIQPLHWIDDKNSGITIAIYPGIELYQTIDEHLNQLGDMDLLDDAVLAFGNKNRDPDEHNSGFVRILDSEQKEGALPLVLDADEHFQESTHNKSQLPSSDIDSHKKASHKKAIDSAIKLRDPENISNEIVSFYMQAFEYHQPLRRAFAQAFKHKKPGEAPNKKAIEKAWNMAKNYHDKGYGIWKKVTSQKELPKPQEAVKELKQKMGLGFNVIASQIPAKILKRELIETRKLFSPWSKENSHKIGKIPLKDVPLKKRTYNICMKRLERDPADIRYVPVKLIDDKMLNMFLGKYSECVKYIPKRYKKPKDFWLRYIKEFDGALSKVPKYLLNNTLIKAYIDHNSSSVIHYLPDEKQTKPICLYAVQKDPFALEYVPEKHKTEDLCMKAFKLNKNTLKYFPEELITINRIKTAMRSHSNKLTLADIPKSKRTREVCALAIKANPIGIIDLPKEYYECPKLLKTLRTNNIWDYITKNADDHVQRKILHSSIDIPQKALRDLINIDSYALTEERIQKKLSPTSLDLLIEKHPRYLNYIDRRYYTQKMWELALEDDPYNIDMVPTHKLTWKMCLNALKKCPKCIGFIPKFHLSKTLCNYAFKQDKSVLKRIPDKYITKEMCIELLDSDTDPAHIPYRFRTKEVCLYAILNPSFSSINIIKSDFIPEQLWEDRDFCLQFATKSPVEIAYLPIKWLEDDDFIKDYLKLNIPNGNYNGSDLIKEKEHLKDVIKRFKNRALLNKAFTPLKEIMAREIVVEHKDVNLKEQFNIDKAANKQIEVLKAAPPFMPHLKM